MDGYDKIWGKNTESWNIDVKKNGNWDMTQSKSGSNDLEEIIKKLKEKVEELKKENWDVKKENDRLNEHIQLMEMERDKWMTK